MLTGAGLALGVAMLLVAAVVYPALHAHDVRRGWTETSAQNAEPAQDERTTDPLLWRLTEVRYDGRDIERVDVAATGPDAPVPPGLDAAARPGRDRGVAAAGRAARRHRPIPAGRPLPRAGRATIGRDALASPDDLVVFVGHAPDELRAQPGVDTVHSIEAAPVSRNLTRAMRIVFAIGGVGLLLPVLVFMATATRLAAARREQRLAALRLVGATTGQVGVVAAVEAVVAAVGGVAVGFGLFLAVRPRLARVPIDRASFYPADLRLSVGWALAVASAVVARRSGRRSCRCVASASRRWGSPAGRRAPRPVPGRSSSSSSAWRGWPAPSSGTVARRRGRPPSRW